MAQQIPERARIAFDGDEVNAEPELTRTAKTAILVWDRKISKADIAEQVHAFIESLIGADS